MYQPMLYLHWKQVRLGLIPLVLAAFGLPLLSVQGIGTPLGMEGQTLEAYRILNSMQDATMFYPLLAAAIGVMLALSAWNWDHQQKHVHALSLPLARHEYVMLKMGAGVVLAALPALALWLGGLVAVAAVELPVGLQSYTNWIALRFFIASVLAFAVFFALASGTIKTTVWISSLLLAFFVIGGPFSEFLGLYFGFFERYNVVELVLRFLIESPGPMEIFTGNWTLIDV